MKKINNKKRQIGFKSVKKNERNINKEEIKETKRECKEMQIHRQENRQLLRYIKISIKSICVSKQMDE